MRTEGRLRGLSAAQLEAVEETATAVGLAVAGCLIESAASDESLAAVLAGLYPSVGPAAVPG